VFKCERACACVRAWCVVCLCVSACTSELHAGTYARREQTWRAQAAPARGERPAAYYRCPQQRRPGLRKAARRQIRGVARGETWQADERAAAAGSESTRFARRTSRNVSRHRVHHPLRCYSWRWPHPRKGSLGHCGAQRPFLDREKKGRFEKCQKERTVGTCPDKPKTKKDTEPPGLVPGCQRR